METKFVDEIMKFKESCSEHLLRKFIANQLRMYYLERRLEEINEKYEQSEMAQKLNENEQTR